MVLNLLISLLKNPKISKHILVFAGLSKTDREDLYNRTFQEKLLKLCLEMFKVEAPIYRVSTLKTSGELINLLFARESRSSGPLLTVAQQQTPAIGPEAQKLLAESYRCSIQRVSKYMYNCGKEWEKLVQIYDKAESQLKSVTIKDIYTLGLAECKELKGFDRLPQEQNDLILHEFGIFLILRDLRYGLMPHSKLRLSEVNLKR